MVFGLTLVMTDVDGPPVSVAVLVVAHLGSGTARQAPGRTNWLWNVDCNMAQAFEIPREPDNIWPLPDTSHRLSQSTQQRFLIAASGPIHSAGSATYGIWDQPPARRKRVSSARAPATRPIPARLSRPRLIVSSRFNEEDGNCRFSGQGKWRSCGRPARAFAVPGGTGSPAACARARRRTKKAQPERPALVSWKYGRISARPG